MVAVGSPRLSGHPIAWYVLLVAIRPITGLIRPALPSPVTWQRAGCLQRCKASAIWRSVLPQNIKPGWVEPMARHIGTRSGDSHGGNPTARNGRWWGTRHDRKKALWVGRWLKSSPLRMLPLAAACLILLLAAPQGALASANAASYVAPTEPLSRSAMFTRLCLWYCLFTTSAVLAGAETAITTLWPWKVKQLAAEDGEGSPFAALQTDITKVLTTVLVGVTFCTIFGTALSTDLAVGLFGKAGVGYATVAITALTLFLGEILPKSLAVAQPERLARATLPVINAISFLLTPLSYLTSVVNAKLLKLLGVRASESSEAVTQPELRMVLTSASQSGGTQHPTPTITTQQNQPVPPSMLVPTHHHCPTHRACTCRSGREL